MSTCFKKGLQSIGFFIATLLYLNIKVSSQPVFLEPELSVTSGLNSNSIRAIVKDSSKRIWLGTDLGLEIWNNTSKFQELIDTINNHSVWTLAFYKRYALIGTRLNGLFIYDTVINKIVQHLDSSRIGLCRRFRVIGDSIFLATKSDPVLIFFRNGIFEAKKLKSNLERGFITDFVKWNEKIYATVYGEEKSLVRELNNDRFIIAEDYSLASTNIVQLSGSFALLVIDTNLFIGGEGSFKAVSKDGNIFTKSLVHVRSKNPLPIWDIANVAGNPFFTVGNPDGENEGMIFTNMQSPESEIKSNFYGQSLYYDAIESALWAGTINRGLFYWPFASNATLKPNPSKDDNFVFEVLNDEQLLVYTLNGVSIFNLNSRSSKEIYRRKSNSYRDDVVLANLYNDTLVVLTRNKVEVVVINKKSIALYSFIDKQRDFANYKYIRKIGCELHLFTAFNDEIFIVDISSRKVKEKRGKSTLPRGMVLPSGKFLYHSLYSGFYIYDTIGHSLNIPIGNVESFTFCNDTLWVLNGGLVTTYKFNQVTYKAKYLFDCDLKAKFNTSWMPTWICQLQGKIYCGNKKGLMLLDNKNAIPIGYVYIGNYSEGSPPKVGKTALFFDHGNYITKISSQQLDSTISGTIKEFKIVPEQSVFKGSPFNIFFQDENYSLQNHSLKLIEIWNSDSLIFSIHSIDTSISITKLFEKGEYTIKCYSNGKLIGEKSFEIKVSITSTPTFYIAVSLFVILFFGLLFKYYLDRKSYQKYMLENRLQLLKQNLNPHFIFNSLNLIYSLVLQNKNEVAVRTINTFSDLHRYYLENINKQRISLEQELTFIDRYLKMEAERVAIDDPFIYNINIAVPNIVKEIYVPPMILQPIVENAVKYASSEKSDRRIWIDLKLDDGIIVISIENTLSPLKHIIHGSKIGLTLVRERIDIYNRSNYGSIQISESMLAVHTDFGYRSEIRILVKR
ncbi:MAG TPA: hypothetical protein DCQ29_07135 [Chitinophagaceae bacterium]|nr:hypothetical protein [Chitinophagaceae bacterium]